MYRHMVCLYYMFACILNLHSTDEMGKSNLVTAQWEFKRGSPETHSRLPCIPSAVTQMGAETHRTEEKVLSPTSWLMMKYFCISSELSYALFSCT